MLGKSHIDSMQPQSTPTYDQNDGSLTSLLFTIRLIFLGLFSIFIINHLTLWHSTISSLNYNRFQTMSKFLLWVLMLLPSLPLSSSSHSEAIEALLSRLATKRAAPSVQESAAKAVLRRLLPTYLDSFQFEIVSKVFFHFRFWVCSISVPFDYRVSSNSRWPPIHFHVKVWFCVV